MQTIGTPTSTIARVQTMPSIGAATSPSTIGALTTIGAQITRTIAGSAIGSLGGTSTAPSPTTGARPTVASGGGGTPTVAGSARGGMLLDEPCEPEEVLCIEVH